MWRILKAGAVAATFLASVPALAQDEEVPYWASIRSEVVNMRVGPAITYRIDWVYRREGLPLKVIRRAEGWRLVEDPDGAKGWVLGRFLSRKRTAVVNGEALAPMHASADPAAPVLWQLEPGVIVEVEECESVWCRIAINGRSGFVAQEQLWGATER